MPWIIRSIMSRVLAIVAGLGTIAPADEPGSPKPVLLDGVSYRARMEVVREGDRSIVRTALLAVEPGTDKPLWAANLRDVPASSDGKPSTASIRPIARGLVVTVNRFFSSIDPATRSVEPLLTGWESKDECEVHHKALIDALVPVVHGLIKSQPWYQDAVIRVPARGDGVGGRLHRRPGQAQESGGPPWPHLPGGRTGRGRRPSRRSELTRRASAARGWRRGR